MLSAELLHFKLELRVRIRFRNTKRNGSIRMICQNIITINLLRDLSNAVLLRSDMHTIFDQRKLVFFPRDNGPNPFVVHMLQPTVDVGQLYHNTCIHIHACGLEFLFARWNYRILLYLRKKRLPLVATVRPNAAELLQTLMTKWKNHLNARVFTAPIGIVPLLLRVRLRKMTAISTKVLYPQFSMKVITSTHYAKRH
ncbi:76706a4c-d9d8-4bf7-a449-5ea11f549952 [Sclerotinia trifoliorum]|uniref:76706a4c-d9d8-4bf7-a449-5ea11f549952 n=1 Tax=Sclerotinia trifoliorum TaxID=28548 RepID=A0A8H2W4L3_9HELO|nr:76706a4c-d9d8-4bf7-a449-5ea11f549952 [Sclerotinia trifoliorum]